MRKTLIAFALLSPVLAFAENVPFVNQFPEKPLYAKGGAVAGEAGRTVLRWTPGGEQPIAAYDFGARSVGGFAILKVKSFKAQGTDASGRTVGYPVVRLAYATHPDGLTEKGCFTRRGCAHYLGPTFDNPVLPANVNRFETYTVTRTGTYVAPLLQGQERYVRVQLDTPGTEVEIESLELRNTGVYSTEPRAGTFRCSDERVNRTWDMSVWTCQIASLPNHDAWHVVDGKLLPRKLEHGACAGLSEKATLAGDGTWRVDFELRTNPHHNSACGLLLRADDGDNGVLVTVEQPAVCRIFRRRGGVNTQLEKMVLDDPIVDGVACSLEARVAGKTVTAYFNGVKIVAADVADMPAGGRFGLYVEKEWWPVVSAVEVTDAKGAPVLREDFSGADALGRLPGWDYTRSFMFMADGAKRDRLVWIGDLWWAARTCFYGYAPDWPYFRESLKLLAYNQNPDGYVWAAPFAEKGPRPGKGECGHFPSDEFSAWLPPITWEYYLYTADGETMKTLYPAVRADLDYLSRFFRADGIFEQRIETSSNVGSMAPKDPSHRAHMNFVLWLAYTDGAKLAKALGHADDAARWQVAADRLAAATRKAFRDPETSLFRTKLERPGTWSGTQGMALGVGLVTPEEALKIAPRVPADGASKFHLAGLRGKFRYGFNEAAFNMLEGGAWFKLSDPSWAGAHCCTECGFLTRSNWWDESHPDTTVAGDISTYLLGIEPVEPGYRTFKFEPHLVRRLSFAEGKVPTPHGFAEVRWDLGDGVLSAKLTVPAGTKATLALPFAAAVKVDGRPYDGGALPPGRHEIVADGITEKAFADPSLLAGFPSGSGEQWYAPPPINPTMSFGADTEFVQTVDLGAVRNLLALELGVGDRKQFPREIRIDVSENGVDYLQQQELTGVEPPAPNKPMTIDLRTVGSSLNARYVRIRSKGVEGVPRASGDVWYVANFGRVRIKYLAD